MRLIKDLVLLLFLFFISSNMAKAQAITYTCTYQNGIKTQKITTSTDSKNVKLKKKANGCKYVFVIADTNNLNYLEDYVYIENDKGHKIVYPLSCSK